MLKFKANKKEEIALEVKQREVKQECEVPTKNYNVLFLGNSGVGKSTLCSTLVRKSGKFKSGVLSTVKTQTAIIPETGVRVTDTPGLENKKTREAAGEAILTGLQISSKGKKNSYTKLLFVVNTTGGGTIDPHAKLSANQVMRSICKDNSIPIFHVVVNSMSQSCIDKLVSLEDKHKTVKRAFLEELSSFKMRSVVFIPNEEELVSERDMVLSGTQEIIVCGPDLIPLFRNKSLMAICNSLEATSYKCHEVKPLELNRWDKLVESFPLMFCCLGGTERIEPLTQNKKDDDERIRKQKLDDVIDGFGERMFEITKREHM